MGHHGQLELIVEVQVRKNEIGDGQIFEGILLKDVRLAVTVSSITDSRDNN